MNRHLLRRLAATVLAGGLAVALVACGGDDADGGADNAPSPWDSASIQQTLAGSPWTPAITNSPNGTGVGVNRLSIALFTEDGSLVPDAQVHARLYRLAERPDEEPEVGELATEVDLVARVLDIHEDHQHAAPQGARLDAPRSSTHPVGYTTPHGTEVRIPAHDDALTAVYTANVEFDRPGWWGVSIDVTVDGETRRGLQMRRFVLEDTPMPGIGDQAVPSEHLTLSAAGGDVTLVSTALDPVDEMLDQTVAEVLESGRPSVIAFVTPAFCQTRFCGPVLEMVVTPVYQDYGDRVNFVHIEPFELERARSEGIFQPVPSVLEWGLETEPFIYVVDADGVVVAGIEGITDEAELREAVKAALG